MKRLKQLLVIGLAAVMVFAFAACGKSSKTLSSINVDTTAAKTEYTVGESFTSDGIIVTATYDDETTAEVTNYEVDDSAYDSSKAGTYSIGISYTENEVTKPTSYSVTVTAATSGEGDDGGDDQEETNEYYGGLYVTKTTTEYTVSSADGVTVNTDDLSVYLVDQDGNVTDTALASSEYTLKYAKDGDFIESLENLTEGKYQIWAYCDNPYSDEPDQLKSWVFINVYDTVSSIALSNAETGTFTQAASTDDEMSATWEYTLTYASGITETIYATDSNLSITGLTTSAVVTDATATVTYTKVDALGNSTELTCEVTYSITKASTNTTSVSVNISELASAGTLASTITSETALASGISVMATEEKTVTVDENGKEIDGFTFTHRLKLGGAGDLTYRSIKIETTGAATITLYAMSGSNGTSRTLALYDSTYTLVDGTQSDDGTAIAKYTFTVEEAGIYYIASTSGGMNVYYINVETEIVEAETVINISELASAGTLASTITSETALASGISVMATEEKTVTVDENGKEIDGFTFTHRLKLGGAGDLTYRSIKIETTGAATITLYAMSGSSGTSRTLALYDSTYTLVDGTQSDDGTAIAKYTFTVEEAGTYYIASTSGGMNIYYISVVG